MESLCCTPEINITLYIIYISIKKKRWLHQDLLPIQHVPLTLWRTLLPLRDGGYVPSPWSWGICEYTGRICQKGCYVTVKARSSEGYSFHLALWTLLRGILLTCCKGTQPSPHGYRNSFCAEDPRSQMTVSINTGHVTEHVSPQIISAPSLWVF